MFGKLCALNHSLRSLLNRSLWLLFSFRKLFALRLGIRKLCVATLSGIFVPLPLSF